MGKDIIEDDGVSNHLIDLHCDLITVHVSVVMRQHICETCELSAFHIIDVVLFNMCSFTGRRLQAVVVC